MKIISKSANFGQIVLKKKSKISIKNGSNSKILIIVLFIHLVMKKRKKHPKIFKMTNKMSNFRMIKLYKINRIQILKNNFKQKKIYIT